MIRSHSQLYQKMHFCYLYYAYILSQIIQIQYLLVSQFHWQTKLTKSMVTHAFNHRGYIL